MTDFSDMYGNPIDIGDVVLSDSYGGGFAPEPVVIYAYTAKMIKVALKYRNLDGNYQGWRGMEKTIMPDKVVKYPFELLMGDRRKRIEQTFRYLSDRGIYV